MSSWPLQEAKAGLGEGVDAAKRERPQIISRHGVEEAAMVPIDQCKQMNSGSDLTLLEALQAGPQFNPNLPPRGRMRMRKPVDF